MFGKKRKGAGIVIITVVCASIIAAVSFGAMKLIGLDYKVLEHTKVMVMADSYATDEAMILRTKTWDTVSPVSRQQIGTTDFEKEVILDMDTIFVSCKINIYYKKAAKPCVVKRVVVVRR